MSLSDCEKCWDTLCTCGWKWRHVPLDDLIRFQRVLGAAIAFRQARPDARFSMAWGRETADDAAYMAACDAARRG